jgi:leucyl-tRNA synthetase
MNKSRKFDHKAIESRWQRKWEKEKVNYPADMFDSKKRFYNLWMFPYPSAEGLHAGHAFASTGSDVYGRFMRMNGKNVFQPIGYDSFGIHGENFAIKKDVHPQKLIDKTTQTYAKQLKSLGHGYDWTRTVTTSDADYYRWTQWFFIQMFKSGLAYRKKSTVNWCPSCKTVLADEQVMTPKQAGKEPRTIDGKKIENPDEVKVCERCGYVVEKKDLAQWHFRITDYADKLLDGLKKIDWPEKIKLAQKNWIGRSEGATLKFQISKCHSGAKHSGAIESQQDPLTQVSSSLIVPIKLGLQDDNSTIEVFTTRPDTLYGATFFVLSPEHSQVADVTSSKYKEQVQKYIDKSKQKTREDRIADANKGKKMGVFTGGHVLNPATKKKIPVYIADYVSMEYGTGAIMGVPAHDQRDWDFAKAHKLPIVEVISGGEVNEQAYDGKGRIVNSENWDGLQVPSDIGKVIDGIEKNGWGERTVNYHLRDWIISRQRYWGPPIPMIYCESCAKEGKSWFTERGHSGAKQSGARESQRDPLTQVSSLLIVPIKSGLQDDRLLHGDQSDWNNTGWWPVSENDLPVKLPNMVDYKPKGTGRGPLADHPDFYEIACPECGGAARRETDVSDTFLDSSWYFLRYPSVNCHSGAEQSGARESREGKTMGSYRSVKASLQDDNLPWNREITKAWLPVDLYFGGAEHAVLHLMYARFVTLFLHDSGYVDFDEPFPHFYAHGLMIKDGAKMSKSRGNTVNPDEYIKKYGADTLRLYSLFLGPMDGYPDFRDTGIEGMRRFVEKVWRLCNRDLCEEKDSKEVSIKLHQTIKKVTKDIQKFHYNTVIASIMELVNTLRAQEKVAKESILVLTQLLAPFAPHLAEHVWCEVLGEKFSVHKSSWPKFDPKLVKEEFVTIAVQVNGKLRATIELKAENLPAGRQGSKLKEEVIKMAKEDEKVQKWILGKKIKKEIFVSGKLVNFATS